MSDLVSVIIPNYNGERFLDRCIQSVLNQSYQNWEIILIDDCSTDSSRKIIELYQNNDSRIRSIFLDKNQGAAVTRNYGIEKANGRFIAFLDNDDSWLPNKLQEQVDFMLNNKCALSYSSYISVNENFDEEKLIQAKPYLTYKQLLTSNYIGCLTAMYDASILGKRYFPEIRKRQDWALWLQIIKDGYKAKGIQNPLALYTRRTNSVSSNKLKLLKYNWKVYREITQLPFFYSLYLFIILVYKRLVK